MRDSGHATMVAACPTCHDHRHQKLPTPGHWIGREVFETHRDTFGLSRCMRCGLVFVNPRPNEELLAAFYGGQTYECHSPDSATRRHAKAHFVLERALHHVPNARRILDYGCGSGCLLRAARERGLDAVGFDIGAGARRTCRDHGFTVVADPSDLEPGSFDLIVMNHVFEHLPDPRRALSDLPPLLSGLGQLLVEVPNVASLRARLSASWLSRWFGFDERHRAFPIHLWYFEPRTLSLLVSQCGFEVKTIETYGLGLDELFFDESAGTSKTTTTSTTTTTTTTTTTSKTTTTTTSKTTTTGTATSSTSRIRDLLPEPFRRAIKRTLFDRALGENMLVLCAPGHGATVSSPTS